MARTARKRSDTGIYHVMLRGINRAQIFLDDEDNRQFLGVLTSCRKQHDYGLYAYCLMGNHVHLLLQVREEPIEQLMKRIGTRYVMWYNAKYYRAGHLFQDRYKSEPIQDEGYFLTALRYILNNPVKAGICKQADHYLWSSARDYYAGGGITDTAFAKEMAGADVLMTYLKELSEDECMDDRPVRLNDREAQNVILKVVGGENIASSLHQVTTHPEQYVHTLRKAGLSIRQISRLTGLSVGIVRK